MGRLIVASNRVAIPNGEIQAGGLAVALQEALNREGGIWCGWSGLTREYTKCNRQTVGSIDYITMDMTPRDHEDYYIGFCNSLLWPLFHYRTDLMHYRPAMFQGYQRVNEQFASTILKYATADDLIWVHDYHLMTLGAHLREQGMKNRIGFFLHIPFPAPEVFSTLPVHCEILSAICAYDVVGFQTERDLNAFLRCVREFIGGSYETRQDKRASVQVGSHRFTAGVFPISIDTKDMIRAAESEESPESNAPLTQALANPMVIGVDRLDYSKGLLARMGAYARMLEKYPQHQGQVSYVQITPTSRGDVDDYRELSQEVEASAARINAKHADMQWLPIRYINKSFPRERLAGFYRASRVGLVTPLRDGMNLVAKEYVASQDPRDPGVLVLSQFAGAAEELKEALLVNPHDTDGMADAIAQALAMPLAERQVRHQAMMKVLNANDIYHWTEGFLKCLTPRDAQIIIHPAQLQSSKKAARVSQ